MTEDEERTAELRATTRAERLRTPLRIEDRKLPTIDHHLFGRVWAPQNFTDLTTLLAAYGWSLGGGWRGQSDIDWYLDSTAVRRIGEPRPEDDRIGTPDGHLETLVQEYEMDLLNRARLAGHGRVGGRDLHDLELLALLRHHGAATRLMDFTRNVWIALWFACREHRDRFGLVVGLNLRNAFELRDQDALSKPYLDQLDDVGDRLAIWSPSALSPRMPAQQGLFLWGVARYYQWGSIGEADDAQEKLFDVDPQTSSSIPGLRSIAVGPELKHELSMRWHTLFGYSMETMFPDRDGFARANAATEPLDPGLFDDGDEEGDDEPPSDEENEAVA